MAVELFLEFYRNRNVSLRTEQNTLIYEVTSYQYPRCMSQTQQDDPYRVITLLLTYILKDLENTGIQ